MNDESIDSNPLLFNKNDNILIQKLSKKFGDFYAVKDLTFSIKKNEILTLLGHNGAGKTTAIYMLTGVLSPSSGDAFINGYSIANNLDEVQQRLGLC